MRHNVSILSRTSLLVLVFALLLSAGILSLSHFYGGVEPNDGTFLTPETAVAAPTAQDLLQKKFDTYNTVTEKDGKKTVTIYSEQQISDFNTRRHNGEWFWLSSEETLFLINDTIKLFETYDEVYVRALDGTVKKYYGLSFFSSEAYFASFGGFDLGVTDASFDLKKDVYETILARITVLNSAMLGQDAIPFAVIDISKRLSITEILMLEDFVNPWCHISSASMPYGILFFNDETIYFYRNIQSNVYTISLNDSNMVFPSETFSQKIPIIKYDIAELNVVIELYEEKSQKLIARIRCTEKTMPTETSQLISMAEQLSHDMIGAPNVSQNTDYRIAVYFNCFELNHLGIFPAQIGFTYCPDGDLNLFSVTAGDDIFQDNLYSLSGCRALAEYINRLLAKQLSN